MRKTSFLRAIQGAKAAFLRLPPILLLPLGAVLCALCLLYPKLGFLQWLAMVPALYYLFSRVEGGRIRLRRAYGLGFLYFYSFYLVIWHWFVDLYPMAFAGITKGEAIVLIAICWLGLSLLQAALFALALPVLTLLSRTRLIRKCPVLFPFLFASVYTVAEWAQTITWAGVPWARLVLGQVEMPVKHHFPTRHGRVLFVVNMSVRKEKRLVFGGKHRKIRHNREFEHHLVDFAIAISANGDNVFFYGIERSKHSFRRIFVG